MPRDELTAVEQGTTWWNALDEDERAQWMERAGNTGIVADAWETYKNYDPTRWCDACGARTADKCTCLPMADNE